MVSNIEDFWTQQNAIVSSILFDDFLLVRTYNEF